MRPEMGGSHRDDSGHDHGHDHGHGHAAPADAPAAPHDHTHGASGRRLAIALAIVVTTLLVEVVGGVVSGSLALLADAGHMFSDAASLAIAVIAVRMARKPADARRTYGYHRAEVLAAVVNAATLIVIAVGIAWSAADRWGHPPEVNSGVMLGVAAFGLLSNLVSMRILAGGRNDNLNVRAAWLHVVSDAMGSVGAIAAAIAINAGFPLADPIASVAIAALVLRGSWALMNEAVAVLMEGAPPHIDVDAVREAVLKTEGVADVHDLHVWTITSGMVSLSVHVRAADGASTTDTLHRIAEMLRRDWGIQHTTIQVEPPGYIEAAMHP